MHKIKQEQGALNAVEWVARIPSTNSELLRRIAEGKAAASGLVLAAHHQTAGRGRLQRTWQSGAGQDLTFSFLWPPAAPERAVSLPMAVALAIVDLLAAYGIAASTKWPNDVLVDGRKICGLLAESATDKAGQAVGTVVGVGLNVNMTAQAAARIDRPATSMQILTGQSYTVPALLDQLLPFLTGRLTPWCQGGFPAIRADWESRAIWLNQTVELHTDHGPVTGILRGYGNAGELLLDVNGTRSPVWSAELMRCVSCA